MDMLNFNFSHDEPEQVPAFWESSQYSHQDSRFPCDQFATFMSSQDVLDLASQQTPPFQSERLYTNGLRTPSLTYTNLPLAVNGYQYGVQFDPSSDLDDSDSTEPEPHHEIGARADSFDLAQLLYSQPHETPHCTLLEARKRNLSDNDVRYQRPPHAPKHHIHAHCTPDSNNKRDLARSARKASSEELQPPRLRNQPRYTCTKCGKVFNRPSSLATHNNTHTGDKPYCCPFDNCDKQFNARSNMTRHYKLHFKTDIGTYVLPNGEVTKARPSMRQLADMNSGISVPDLISFINTADEQTLPNT